jgi:hypothetical protein
MDATGTYLAFMGFLTGAAAHSILVFAFASDCFMR